MRFFPQVTLPVLLTLSVSNERPFIPRPLHGLSVAPLVIVIAVTQARASWRILVPELVFPRWRSDGGSKDGDEDEGAGRAEGAGTGTEW